MENGDEGEEKNIAQQSVGCIALPEVKQFEQNRVGRMVTLAVAPAGAKVSGQRESGRKSGQQQVRRDDL
jgi:hypothetical protein